MMRSVEIVYQWIKNLVLPKDQLLNMTIIPRKEHKNEFEIVKLVKAKDCSEVSLTSLNGENRDLTQNN